jgi:hypothetical protein
MHLNYKAKKLFDLIMILHIYSFVFSTFVPLTFSLQLLQCGGITQFLLLHSHQIPWHYKKLRPLQPRNLWLQVLNDYMYDFSYKLLL